MVDTDDFENMILYGETAMAIKRRHAYIIAETLQIFENGKELSPLMNHLIKTYWKEILTPLGENFSAISVSPYYFKKVQFMFEGKKYTEMVPQIIRLGQFDYNVEISEDMETTHKFNFRSAGRFGPNRFDIFHVKSLRYSGVNPYDIRKISSELAVIRPQWKTINLQRKNCELGEAGKMNPVIYLEAGNNKFSKFNSEIEKYDAHLRYQYDSYDSELSGDIIKFDKETNTAIIRSDLKLSDATKILFPDSTENKDNRVYFQMMVNKTLGLPNSENWAFRQGHITNAIIDEANQNLSSTLVCLIDDYKNAICKMWRELYDTEIEVNIYHRGNVSSEQIENLLKNGLIDEEFASRELFRIAGIPIVHLTKKHRGESTE